VEFYIGKLTCRHNLIHLNIIYWYRLQRRCW